MNSIARSLKTADSGRLKTWVPVTFCLFLLPAMLSCGRGPALESVLPPKQLEHLDVGVRKQFQMVWDAVQEPSSQNAKSKSEAWGALGQWFQAYRFPESAAICYRNANALDPDMAKWLFYLGQLDLEAGRLESAKAYFNQVLVLQPDSIEALLQLGDMASNAQDLSDAAGHFQKVLALDPDNPDALFGMGNYHFAQGELAACVAVLEKLLAQQPDASQVHYLMGSVLVQMGEADRAKVHFDKVPKDNNQHVVLRGDRPWTDEIQKMKLGSRLLTKRGLQALEKGNYKVAAKLLGKAVADNPNNPEVRVNYAIILENLGRLHLAKSELDKVLAMDPDNLRANLVLGRMGVEGRRFTAADKFLRRALEIDPNSPEAHIQMGKLRQIQNRYEETLTHYAAVRHLNRPLVGTRFWYSALLSLTQGIETALAAVEKDLTVLPEAPMLQLLRIRFLVTASDQARDVAQAKKLLRSLQVEPDVFYAETVAMVAAAAGDFSTAVAWQNTGLETLESLRARKPAQVARRRLILYENREPCQTPWESDEAHVTKQVPSSERLP